MFPCSVLNTTLFTALSVTHELNWSSRRATIFISLNVLCHRSGTNRSKMAVDNTVDIRMIRNNRAWNVIATSCKGKHHARALRKKKTRLVRGLQDPCNPKTAPECPMREQRCKCVTSSWFKETQIFSLKNPSFEQGQQNAVSLLYDPKVWIFGKKDTFQGILKTKSLGDNDPGYSNMQYTYFKAQLDQLNSNNLEDRYGTRSIRVGSKSYCPSTRITSTFNFSQRQEKPAQQYATLQIPYFVDILSALCIAKWELHLQGWGTWMI